MVPLRYSTTATLLHRDGDVVIARWRWEMSVAERAHFVLCVAPEAWDFAAAVNCPPGVSLSCTELENCNRAFWDVGTAIFGASLTEHFATNRLVPFRFDSHQGDLAQMPVVPLAGSFWEMTRFPVMVLAPPRLNVSANGDSLTWDIDAALSQVTARLLDWAHRQAGLPQTERFPDDAHVLGLSLEGGDSNRGVLVTAAIWDGGEKGDVPNAVAAIATVSRELTGTGSHRILRTSVEVPVSMLENERECGVLSVEVFPPSAFVDVDELRRSNAITAADRTPLGHDTRVGTPVALYAPLNFQDVEVPTDKAPPAIVMSYAPFRRGVSGKTAESRSEIRMHLRYQSMCFQTGMGNVISQTCPAILNPDLQFAPVLLHAARMSQNCSTSSATAGVRLAPRALEGNWQFLSSSQRKATSGTARNKGALEFRDIVTLRDCEVACYDPGSWGILSVTPVQRLATTARTEVIAVAGCAVAIVVLVAAIVLKCIRTSKKEKSA
eukprot:Polyplicarium_translucidae@DN1232_c0_g1_i1.p1